MTVVRGGVGTGKTTMMREAARGIKEGGHKAFAFAPPAEASRIVVRTECCATATRDSRSG